MLKAEDSGRRRSSLKGEERRDISPPRARLDPGRRPAGAAVADTIDFMYLNPGGRGGGGAPAKRPAPFAMPRNPCMVPESSRLGMFMMLTVALLALLATQAQERTG